MWTYCQRLRNLMATLSMNICGVELVRDNRETTLQTTKGPLHRPKIEVWSTNGYNKAVILPTLRNHHLLVGGGHHVGLPLGVSSMVCTFI